MAFTVSFLAFFAAVEGFFIGVAFSGAYDLL